MLYCGPITRAGHTEVHRDERDPDRRAVPVRPVLRGVPALARRPPVVLGLLRPRRVLGVARRRAPGRGGLRRRARRAGLAARRPPPHQLPARPRHHAPRAGRDLVRHGDLTPWATWHANDMVVAVQRPGLRRQLRVRPRRPLRRHARAERHRPDLARPRRPRRHAAPRRRPTSPFPNGTVITDDGTHAHHRRELRRPPDRLRPRRGRHARPTGGSGPRSTGVAPDGICLCADGSVWVSNALARRVRPGGRGRRGPRARRHDA